MQVPIERVGLRVHRRDLRLDADGALRAGRHARENRQRAQEASRLLETWRPETFMETSQLKVPDCTVCCGIIGGVTGARSALIVGAGIGGLATGLALKRAGWNVRIFERAANPRELGFALLLAPNAIAALEELGVAAPVVAAGATPTSAEVRRPDGRVLRRIDVGRQPPRDRRRAGGRAAARCCTARCSTRSGARR